MRSSRLNYVCEDRVWRVGWRVYTSASGQGHKRKDSNWIRALYLPARCGQCFKWKKYFRGNCHRTASSILFFLLQTPLKQCNYAMPWYSQVWLENLTQFFIPMKILFDVYYVINLNLNSNKYRFSFYFFCLLDFKH